MAELRCDDVCDMLSAHLDNELSAAQASAVADHLAACAACAAAFVQLQHTSTAMRQHMPVVAAPDLLRARVRAALRNGTAEPARAGAWRRQLVAGLLIAVASSALTVAVMVYRPAAGEPMSAQVFASHVRSLMTHHLTDVASTDQHNVKPWFNGRVDFSPEVSRLDSAGFPLVGGRVDTVGARAVAAIVYGRRQHVISVFTWPVTNAGPVLRDTVAAAHGYNALRWQHGDMEFWAVSDLNVAELRQFVDAFRRQDQP